MKNLLLKVLLVGVFLGFSSFASASDLDNLNPFSKKVSAGSFEVGDTYIFDNSGRAYTFKIVAKNENFSSGFANPLEKIEIVFRFVKEENGVYKVDIYVNGKEDEPLFIKEKDGQFQRFDVKENFFSDSLTISRI